ncbi:MAG: DUF3391 domain-containing protein [Methylovulum sp.]|nr:DUF3391 domain-containing protein [Methylovulum sp.]
MRKDEIAIDASQLRPGVRIRIPGSWLTHGFFFNSFIIADDEQVRQIASMNLPQIFCDVKRSKVPPLPSQQVFSTTAPADEPADNEGQASLASLIAEISTENVERTKLIATMRRRLDKAHSHYLEASRSINNAFKLLGSEPKKSIMQISDVSEKSITVLLSDPDSAITLITEKGQHEGQAAHALSVMTLAQLLGRQAGLPEEALHTIGIGALLHDIGKLTFHSSVLRNTQRNEFEEAVYKSHCRVGYHNALQMGTLSPAMLDIILHHHERIDGKGFPDQLRGDDISFAARIVAIANRFDNLTNPVDHLRSILPSEALAMMWSKENGKCDKRLLQLFIRAMGVYPPGSIILLSDKRVGVVVASAMADNPLRPKVLIYERDVPRSQAMIIDLAQESSIKIERPLNLRERPEEEIEYLLPRRKISWQFYKRVGEVNAKTGG